MSLFECVPNFSEGRDAAKVERIAAAGRAVPGVTVLDIESDAAHHRSVISLVGEGGALLDAVFRMMTVATATIDLNQHHGEHPRMGATDVVPFVPLGTSTMADAVRLAERLGERVAKELDIPVYLYAAAARRPERADLAKVREGQFEGIRDSIGSDPARAPDFGPSRVHPSAGAVAIGARPVLIAFNAYLTTPDVAIAKKVARAVRARDGGLPEVKALGFEIPERHRAQVSMNLTDYRTTPVHRALEAVRREAQRYGVAVEESEIVGLVPEDALFDAAEYYLQLHSFDRAAVLERKVRAAEVAARGGESLPTFTDRLAARTPTPGGGSAAAAAGALAAALGEMVLAYSIDPAKPTDDLREVQGALAAGRRRLLVLIEEDAQSYEAVRTARRARKERPGDGTTEAAYLTALRSAAMVPLETARLSEDSRGPARSDPRSNPEGPGERPRDRPRSLPSDDGRRPRERRGQPGRPQGGRRTDHGGRGRAGPPPAEGVASVAESTSPPRAVRPAVWINCAASADGRLAYAGGRQAPLSSPEDLRRVQQLRANADAILVGVGTVAKDDPSLRVHWDLLGLPEGKSPTRIVVDSGRADARERAGLGRHPPDDRGDLRTEHADVPSPRADRRRRASEGRPRPVVRAAPRARDPPAR